MCALLTFAEMWCNDIDLHRLSPNETHTRLLITIDVTQSRTQIAISEMFMSGILFL